MTVLARYVFCLLMIRRPPVSTPPYPHCPYTTLFRSRGGQRHTAFLCEHPQRRDRVRHDRRLGVFGEGQLVLRPLAHQLEETLAECLVDLLKHFAGVARSLGKRLAHADRLTALTRKDECAHRASPANDRI